MTFKEIELKTGTLTKIREKDWENGIEAKYEYAVDGVVYELEKISEQYRYQRRNAQFASVGYRDVWKAYVHTPDGLRYAATRDTRKWLLEELDERAEEADRFRRLYRGMSRIERGMY